VASVMSHDKEEFSNALGDPLYSRIREALYSTTTSGSEDVNSTELQQVARIHPAESLVESKQGGEKDVSKEDKRNQCSNNFKSLTTDATALEDGKVFGEIVDLGKEEMQSVEDDEKVNGILDKVGPIVQKGKRSVFIRSDVEQALETLEKAISMVREYRFHVDTASSSFAKEESPCMKKHGRVNSYSTTNVKPSGKNEISVEVVPNNDIQEGTSGEAPWTNSDIQNLR
jgi:hypothetical protein